jgi:hypothetical protein
MSTAVEPKPQSTDLRDPAGVARVDRIMREGISLVTASAKATANELATLTVEVKTADKSIAALRKLGNVPTILASKLSHLRDRLAEVTRNGDIQTRILSAKQSEHAVWLSQGTPSNAELLEKDSILDKALDAVRGTVGL